MIINDKAYDLSKFAEEHPGGKDIIVKYAGKDATTIFDSLHSKDVLNTLPPSSVLGQIDMKEPKPKDEVIVAHTSPKRSEGKPAIRHMQNVLDFEAVAQSVMTKEGWGYYSSGADDEITLRENHTAFQRIWLRPRVMVNVKNICMRTTILGQPSALPIYVSATAMGKLAHPEGEVNFTRACHSQGVIQMIPTLASCSFDELVDAAQAGQPQFFQLYVNPNRALTEAAVRKAEQRGCKGLFITVDAPQLGRREKDLRNKASGASDAQKGMSIDTSKGVSTALSSFIDPALCWDDLKWFRSITKMPIVLKGVQCVEDAVQAHLSGCDGIVLSNHGGRQLDFAPSGIEVLPDVMAALRSYDSKMEVYVDGGVRRGTDVFKALALGAKAVGIGRPALYGLAAYGQEGVERVLQLLKDELMVCMRLMGTPSLADISERHVCTRNLGDHFAPQPADYLSKRTYEPLLTGLAHSKL